jgi:membrane fusion protein, heavy metal efflux system
MFIRILALVAATICFLVPLASSRAHEGHDHGPAPAVVATSGALRAEAASAGFELVAVRDGSVLRIWLDRFDTNEPVTDASIEVETPAGTQSATAAPDGAYRLDAPWAQTPGRHDLIFTVVIGADVDILTATLEVPPVATQAADTAAARRAPSTFASNSLALAGAFGLLLGAIAAPALRRRPLVWGPALGLLILAEFGAIQLLAHEGHDHAEQTAAKPVASDRAQILPDGSIYLPKPTQRVLAVRTLQGKVERHSQRLSLPGRIIADPNRSGLVQAAAAGRLSAPEGGFPKLGAHVRAGDILAFVATPFQAIDQSTMRQQQGDLDQQISIAERRLARYETLLKTGAVSQVTLEDTRLELQGLRDRRLALDRSRSQPEALRAPVDGVIAAANAVAGQIADTSTIVFQIVDPTSLYIEAMSVSDAPPRGTASARTSDGRGIALSYVGAGLADRNQARPVHYAVDGDSKELRLGQFVTVLTETNETAQALAVPRGAIVRRSNGESIVFRHATAERFEARVVRARPLDAERVLIVAGVDAGARIVTEAAELLNQVR